MATFIYSGRMASGAKKDGALVADNRETALRQLAAMGIEADKLIIPEPACQSGGSDGHQTTINNHCQFRSPPHARS